MYMSISALLNACLNMAGNTAVQALMLQISFSSADMMATSCEDIELT